jgi:hypothetical protein
LQLFGRRPDPQTDTSLGLTVEQEGSALRVTSRFGQALFKGSDAASFLSAVQAAVQAAVAAVHFSDAAIAPEADDGFTPAEITDLRVAIALHWARYCTSVGIPILVTEAELRHPQTWNLVLQHAERKAGTRARGAFLMAAATLGVDADELERWRRAEDERVALK